MLLHYRNLAIVLLFTIPLNHTTMKIEVRETAMTSTIIAASHRPLLESVASAYAKTKNVNIQQLYHVPQINYTQVNWCFNILEILSCMYNCRLNMLHSYTLGGSKNHMFYALDIGTFHCNKLTTEWFTFRPHSICLAGTCHVPNQFISTVTGVGGHLVESCSLGSIDPTIVWIGECTTVNSWRERENSYHYSY